MVLERREALIKGVLFTNCSIAWVFLKFEINVCCGGCWEKTGIL